MYTIRANTLAVCRLAVCVAYRRTKNFGSHPSDAWLYLPVDSAMDGVIDSPPRIDALRKGETTPYRLVEDPTR